MRARVSVVLCLLLAACGGTDTTIHAPAGYPDTLSGWHFFDGPLAAETPATGVVPYRTIVTLFADFALKHRFVYLPAGTHIGYDAQAKWTFPTGAVLIKTFSFPVDASHPETGEHLVETRLLVREASGTWRPLTYVWNDAQTEATYLDVGALVHLTWKDTTGASHDEGYSVPNVNQCRTCHGETNVELIGLRTRQMDRDYDYATGTENQIDHLAHLGLFDPATPVDAAATREHLVDPFGTDPLDVRARSYLDANCGHCHQAGQRASSSGLYVNWENWDPTSPMRQLQFGRCKPPQATGQGACGLTDDVVPGDPMHSILICRVATNEAYKMPELGRNVIDPDGVTLLTDWIASMPADDCSGTMVDAGMPDAGAPPDAAATDAAHD